LLLVASNHRVCGWLSRDKFRTYWGRWPYCSQVCSCPFPSGLLFTPFLRFAADIFTEGLMLLARSINPSAPTLFHAPLSPHARAYNPPKGGASKSYIPFVHHITVTDDTSSSLFSVSKKTTEQNRHHESKPSIPLPKN